MIKKSFSQGFQILIVFFSIILIIQQPLMSQTNEDCMMCHEDPDLTMEKNGKRISIFVNSTHLDKSAHKKIECISCHKDATDENFPHAEQLQKLRKVSCGSCHNEHVAQAENDIHSMMNVGNKAPSCKTCHSTHFVKRPATVKNKSKEYCGKCHKQDVLSAAYHTKSDVEISCLECHDQTDYKLQISSSIHSKLKCTNCHGYVANNIDEHQEDPEAGQKADCYLCHGPIAEVHKESIHGISLAEGINEAAQCWDCHGSHQIYSTASDSSQVYLPHLVSTCGNCHDDPEFSQKHYSTVKQPGKMYSQSVHGMLIEAGRMDAASCITCHGIHDIKNRVQPGSKISSINLPTTCSECHAEITEKYKKSIHWIAAKKGVRESPICNDCHSEHSIHAINTINKRDEIRKIQEETCLQCHQNLLLSERYGINSENAASYQDSYHGLAVMRGDEDAAMCVDCHGVHSILPKYHEESTIHDKNLLSTCKSCHPYATEIFAKSYSHVTEEDSRAGYIEGIVRKIYIWLIVIVIGGMVLHNVLIFIQDLREKYKRSKNEIRIPRLTKNELIQHLVLLISFIILAITGFQLKYPESWWAKGLSQIGLTEVVRQWVHRGAAIVMISLSLYHTVYLFSISRGRAVLRNILPRFSDVKHGIQNFLYYMRIRKNPPEFDDFSYIEKAEYWALIWGTIVMGITGLILWFPTLVGNWAPVWFIKVCETIHFYEAILATLAILVWHWFFVIFRPKEYPLNFAFIDGKMTVHHYKEEHKLAFYKIIIEWLEWKTGHRKQKQVGNLTKRFMAAIEKAGVSPYEFIKSEIDKDTKLKSLVKEKDLL